MSKKLTKKEGGRPRVYATDLPVYDSMQQCEGATGIPLSVQTKAKAEGCLFVRHGRVHLGEFVRWWFSRDWKLSDDGDGDDEDWGKRDKRAVALTREANLQKTRDLVIEFTVAEAFVKTITGEMFFAELDRIFSEFPATLKGKAELEIKKECDRQREHVRKAIESRVADWITRKGKAK